MTLKWTVNYRLIVFWINYIAQWLKWTPGQLHLIFCTQVSWSKRSIPGQWPYDTCTCITMQSVTYHNLGEFYSCIWSKCTYYNYGRSVVLFEVNLYIDCIRVMVFNATFNNISVISRQSVLLVEDTGVPGENYRPVANHW